MGATATHTGLHAGKRAAMGCVRARTCMCMWWCWWCWDGADEQAPQSGLSKAPVHSPSSPTLAASSRATRAFWRWASSASPSCASGAPLSPAPVVAAPGASSGCTHEGLPSDHNPMNWLPARQRVSVRSAGAGPAGCSMLLVHRSARLEATSVEQWAARTEEGNSSARLTAWPGRAEPEPGRTQHAGFCAEMQPAAGPAHTSAFPPVPHTACTQVPCARTILTLPRILLSCTCLGGCAYC